VRACTKHSCALISHTHCPQHLIIVVHLQFCPFDSRAKARPKAYEGVNFATDVLSDELLTDDDEEDDNDQEDDQMTIDDESFGTKS
jgi:hypothetical protein